MESSNLRMEWKNGMGFASQFVWGGLRTRVGCEVGWLVSRGVAAKATGRLADLLSHSLLIN